MLAVAGFGAGMVPSGGVAKTPGKTYCFRGVCHRVLTLAETRALVGKKATATASYYGDCRSDRFNPCGLTSSGAVFRPSVADNAASPIYPNGTKLLVFNPRNGRAAVVRVNNAGPYKRGRMLDLSQGAATKLGFRHAGVARLIVKVVKAPTPSEARYRARRTYAPVPGYIGRFASVSAALAASGYGGAAANAKLLRQAPDLLWGVYAAMATPLLPVLVEPQPAPLPEQPAPAFQSAIGRLAAAERRERFALERKRRERARQQAIVAAKEKERAEQRQRFAAAAKKRRQAAQAKTVTARRVAVARSGQSAAGPRGGGRSSTPAQAQPKAGRAQRAQTAEAAAPVRLKPRRTVWRREILGVAQNSS